MPKVIVDSTLIIVLCGIGRLEVVCRGIFPV